MDSIPHNKNNRATKIGKIVEFFITFYVWPFYNIMHDRVKINSLQNNSDSL